LHAAAYRIPTETEEEDGTYSWNHTTLVLVEIQAGNRSGIGYTYADASVAGLIRDSLTDCVIGRCALDIRAIWNAMCRSVRNLGRAGLCAAAISAIDTALWDLKARLLDLPLVKLIGQTRAAMPIYGSGGFTNLSAAQLRRQLQGWVDAGLQRVKIKVGRDPAADIERIALSRETIGHGKALFVDANGGFTPRQALEQSVAYADYDVAWFEEPVSSDDIAGLRLLREHKPVTMDIAAGEYAYNADDFRRLLDEECVDVLQADCTRCCGITGLLEADALCEAFHRPLSLHCAPALHLHAGCALSRLVHAEYFYDHVRIESMLFDGVRPPKDGALFPDLAVPGCGLTFKHADARIFAI
jgi:L-alanine-DL-glutamate epimerase-like enolase superfamily enzyme